MDSRKGNGHAHRRTASDMVHTANSGTRRLSVPNWNSDESAIRKRSATAQTDFEKRVFFKYDGPPDKSFDLATRHLEEPHCMKCRATFNLFNHRHRCRNCFLSFCQKCSPARMVVEPFTEPRRVCSFCTTRIQSANYKDPAATQKLSGPGNYRSLEEGTANPRQFLEPSATPAPSPSVVLEDVPKSGLDHDAVGNTPPATPQPISDRTRFSPAPSTAAVTTQNEPDPLNTSDFKEAATLTINSANMQEGTKVTKTTRSFSWPLCLLALFAVTVLILAGLHTFVYPGLLAIHIEQGTQLLAGWTASARDASGALDTFHAAQLSNKSQGAQLPSPAESAGENHGLFVQGRIWLAWAPGAAPTAPIQQGGLQETAENSIKTRHGMQKSSGSTPAFESREGPAVSSKSSRNDQQGVSIDGSVTKAQVTSLWRRISRSAPAIGTTSVENEWVASLGPASIKRNKLPPGNDSQSQSTTQPYQAFQTGPNKDNAAILRAPGLFVRRPGTSGGSQDDKPKPTPVWRKVLSSIQKYQCDVAADIASGRIHSVALLH